MEFEKLVSSLGVAMQNAYRNIEQQNINEFFSGYFENKETNGPEGDTLSPRVIRVNVPCSESGEVVEIPFITLAHHNSMSLDEVKVKLNVKTVEAGERIDMEMCGAPGGTSNDNAVGAGTNEIELTFKRGEAAEGISRINQAASKFL